MKALVGPVIIPVAIVMLARRRLGPIVVGAATALAFHFALWLPWGLSAVWDQAYAYHLDVAGHRTPGRQPGTRCSPRLATATCRSSPRSCSCSGRWPWPEVSRRGSGPSSARSVVERLTSPDGLLLLWLAATVAVLLTEQPLWRPHVSQLVPPLALLVARHRPPTWALAVAAVAVVPYHLGPRVAGAAPGAVPRWRGARSMSSSRPCRGALAISDDPGFVWRAGRRTTDDLVDASVLRIQTHRMSSASA